MLRASGEPPISRPQNWTATPPPGDSRETSKFDLATPLVSYAQNMVAKAKFPAKKAERVPTHPVHVFSAEGEEHLRRVRHICSGLPNTTEKLSHGSPRSFIRRSTADLPRTARTELSCGFPCRPASKLR
jgi:hypothetical protein